MVCLEEFEGGARRPDSRRAAGEVVHLDWKLLEVVDARIQLGDQHQEVGSLVMTMLFGH
jgi:hypothetical protein